MKPCPYCAESIQDAAIKCRYCGSLLVPEELTAESLLRSVPSPDRPEAASEGSGVDAGVNMAWLVVGGLVLIVAVAAVVMVLVGGRSPSRPAERQVAASPPRPAVPHRFLGIVWGTPINEVAAQLASRGFRFTEQDEEGDHVFQGDIDGHPAVVVAMLSRGVLAKTIVIMVGGGNAAYTRANEQLTAEYGPPDDVTGGDARPVTTWPADAEGTGTRLWTTITERGDVAIHYESEQWPAEARRRRSPSATSDRDGSPLLRSTGLFPSPAVRSLSLHG